MIGLPPDREQEGQIELLMTIMVKLEMNCRGLAGNLMSICPDISRLFMSSYTTNIIIQNGVLGKGVLHIETFFR